MERKADLTVIIEENSQDGRSYITQEQEPQKDNQQKESSQTVFNLEALLGEQKDTSQQVLIKESNCRVEKKKRARTKQPKEDKEEVKKEKRPRTKKNEGDERKRQPNISKKLGKKMEDEQLEAYQEANQRVKKLVAQNMEGEKKEENITQRLLEIDRTINELLFEKIRLQNLLTSSNQISSVSMPALEDFEYQKVDQGTQVPIWDYQKDQFIVISKLQCLEVMQERQEQKVQEEEEKYQKQIKYYSSSSEDDLPLQELKSELFQDNGDEDVANIEQSIAYQEMEQKHGNQIESKKDEWLVEASLQERLKQKNSSFPKFRFSKSPICRKKESLASSDSIQESGNKFEKCKQFFESYVQNDRIKQVESQDQMYMSFGNLDVYGEDCIIAGGYEGEDIEEEVEQIEEPSKKEEIFVQQEVVEMKSKKQKKTELLRNLQIEFKDHRTKPAVKKEAIQYTLDLNDLLQPSLPQSQPVASILSKPLVEDLEVMKQFLNDSGIKTKGMGKGTIQRLYQEMNEYLATGTIPSYFFT